MQDIFLSSDCWVDSIPLCVVHSWACDAGFYKQASQASHQEALLYGLCISPCLQVFALLVPALAAFDDELL